MCDPQSGLIKYLKSGYFKHIKSEYNRESSEKQEVSFMAATQIRHIVLAALFTALTTAATLVIQIPSPGNGYVNLGDCMVLLSAWVLGPVGGATAGGLGSMLADLMTGYAYYAPGTLVIKGAMALTAGLIFHAFAGAAATSPRALAARAAGGAAAEAIMVAGLLWLRRPAAGQRPGCRRQYSGQPDPGGIWPGHFPGPGGHAGALRRAQEGMGRVGTRLPGQ